MAVDSGSLLLDATDLANPYGAIIAWPETEGRPTRTAGSRLVTHDGEAIAWMDRAGRRVVLFSEDLNRCAAAIEDLAIGHSKAAIATIDAVSANDHAVVPFLKERGLASGYKGYTLSTARTGATR